MKVLFVSSEAIPFITTGELGDMAGMLPAALRRRDAEVRLILPLYGDMRQEWRDRLKYITNFTVPVSWRNQYCGLFEAVCEGCACYFIDNEYYFKRPGLYGFYDDGERFSFFSRAVLEAVLRLDFNPEIIHCNDWQTALAPVYLNLRYRDRAKLERTKTVFTIHNIQYQGKYGPEILDGTVGLGREDFHVIEFDGLVNYMKGAIELSDVITTVSPAYADEIMDPWYGCGLYDFLRKKKI
jgi:starch synthase